MKLTQEGRRILYTLQHQEWLDMPLSATVMKVTLELSLCLSRPATPDAIEKALHRRGVPVDIGAVPSAWIESGHALLIARREVSA